MATQGMDSPRGQSAGPAATGTASSHAKYPPPPPPAYGYPGYPPQVPTVVKNYMVQAILCAILFPLTGIAAIYHAAKVDPALRMRDVAGAAQASSKAKMFCWISLAVGVLLWLVILGSGG